MAKHRRRAAVITIKTAAVAGIVLLLGGLGITAYAFTLSQSFDNGRTVIDSAFPSDELRPAALGGTAGNAQNILLLGADEAGWDASDGEAGATLDGQRSDTIIVLHVPASRTHIYAISILRDSWVDIPGHGMNKINAALALGGIPLMVQTVETLLDVRMDHVAAVSFEGFEGLTDALGGVSVDNTVAFEADGETFAVGTQLLDGEEALAYVRGRSEFPDGDIQRVKNQQAYIKGVLRGILTPETLLNPTTLSALVSSITPFVQVDADMNSTYISGLALELRSVRSGDITFSTAPISGPATSDDGQAILELDDAGMAELENALKTDTFDLLDR
ncbi:LCP family protein [Naasia lichenicola]|uniref:LytR family transcriptional regulator n=1 Tax=Naasia lichenicola TaxID=2565933 RepID=A0A4S4FPQ8_9MICO|nr:LCP family protein [Naasia lichenicola]THG32294.1 LytR family transcriptional regulator [Naasia lichenicola]